MKKLMIFIFLAATFICPLFASWGQAAPIPDYFDPKKPPYLQDGGYSRESDEDNEEDSQKPPSHDNDDDDDDESDSSVTVDIGEVIDNQTARILTLDKRIAEIAELDADTAKLQNQLDAYKTLLAENSTHIGAYEKKQLAAMEKQISENKEKMSTLIGDPVYLTNGRYYDSQTDFSIRFLASSFDITRTYSTAPDYCGTTGKNWISSLDERLVFGIDAVTEQDFTDFSAEYLVPVEEILSDMKSEYTAEFGKTADEWNQISSEINSLYQEISQLKSNANLQGTLTKIIETACRISPYSQKAEMLNALAQSVNSRAETKYNSYQTAYLLCTDIDTAIKDLEDRLAALNIELQELRDKHTLNLEITSCNAPALFPGTDDCARNTGFTTITLLDGTGGMHLFTNAAGSSAQGAVRSETGTVWVTTGDSVYDSITKTPEGFALLQRDGCRRCFSPEGLLLSVTDVHGNRIEFKRDSAFRLTSIVSSSGRRYQVSYNGSFISAIRQEGREYPLVQYGYTDNRITSVTDSNGGILRFSWNDGLLEKMIKADGSEIVFSYNAVNRNGERITTETTNEEGFSEHFEFDFAGKMTEHTDHAGIRTLYVFDDDFNTVQAVYSGGKTTSWEYDGNGNVTTERTEDYEVSFTYDSLNRKTSAVYSDGSTEYWEWNSAGKLMSYTDRDGIKQTYTLNKFNDITSFSTGGKTVYTCSWTPEGLLASETVFSEQPVTTRFEYDTCGNLTKAVTGSATEEWTWDDDDNITSHSINGKLIATYETKGNIISEITYTGLKTDYYLNDRSDVEKVVETDIYTGEKRVSEYEYDRRHLITGVFKGEGDTKILTERLKYDGEGRNEAAVFYHEEAASVVLYEYEDSSGIKMSEPLFTVLFSLSPVQVRSYNLTTSEGVRCADFKELAASADSCMTLPCSSQSDGTESMYTHAGRISQTFSEYGGSYKYLYDTSGNLSCMSDEYGNKTLLTYYPDGSLNAVYVKEAAESMSKMNAAYHYDNKGHLYQLENEQGSIWYSYDETGEPSEIIMGNSPDKESAVYCITYNYDDNKRHLTVTEGPGYCTTYELNAWGEPVSITDGNGNCTLYVHDCYGNTVSTTDPYGNITGFEYDQTGLLSGMTYPDGSWQKFTYNAAGKLTSVTDQSGTVLVQEYDERGNLTRKAGRLLTETKIVWDDENRLAKVFEGGTLVQSYEYPSKTTTIITDALGHSTQYQYDRYGTLLSETDRNGQFHQRDDTVSDDVTITDMVGNITEVTDADTHLLFLYDSGARLIRQKNILTGFELSFAYDKAGNRTEMSDGNRTVRYEYGRINELLSMTEYENGVVTSGVSFSYDCMGREISRTYSNGTMQQTAYDAAGNVELVVIRDKSGSIIHGEGFVYDETGRTCACIDQDMHITLYSYDRRNCLSSIRVSAASSDTGSVTSSPVYLSSDMFYSLQALLNKMHVTLGNRLSVMQMMTETTFTYDASLNRLSITTDDETVSFEYDAENRLIKAGDTVFSYDENGNLHSEISDTQIVTYGYSSDDRITSVSVTDFIRGTTSMQTYQYDALGRRTASTEYTVSPTGEPVLNKRTYSEYDGFSLEKIKDLEQIF